jgi:hypothetical protein
MAQRMILMAPSGKRQSTKSHMKADHIKIERQFPYLYDHGVLARV